MQNPILSEAYYRYGAPAVGGLATSIKAAREEEIRNRPSGFTPQKNISFWDPSAVAFRRQHGISDDIGAGL